MFVLGIFVGRGTVPVQFDTTKLQKELADLREAAVREREVRFKIDQDAADKKVGLDFFEALKNAEGDTGPAADIPEKKVEPLPEKIRLKKEQVAEAPKKDRVDTNDAPEVRENFTIQVVSLRDSEDADRVVARLVEKGYSAYRTVTEIPGRGTWHRVRIGNFKDKAEADSTLNRLKNEGFVPILLQRQGGR